MEAIILQLESIEMREIDDVVFILVEMTSTYKRCNIYWYPNLPIYSKILYISCKTVRIFVFYKIMAYRAVIAKPVLIML